MPVLTSELGARRLEEGYVGRYLDWADEHDVGVLFWVWADHPGDPMALVTGERGRPTVSGRVARTWLTDHLPRG